MTEKINLPIPLSELHSLVLETFKKKPETQYIGLCSDVANLAIEKKIVSNNKQIGSIGGFCLGDKDEDRVREIIWDLIVERVVTIGINSSNPEWPHLKLTDYGKKIINSSMPVPHDPSGYVNRIKSEIKNLDPIILTYLEESLKTYNINALLSSTIALGCASEKALLLLIESYKNAIQDIEKQTEFKRKTEKRFIKTQFDNFTKSLRTLQHIPKDITDGLDIELLGLFEMIRNNRNDAGHPTGKSIDKEHAFANLQVFIPYCKKIYQLISYFQSNQII